MFLRLDECSYYGCFLLAPACFAQKVCRYGQLACETGGQQFLKHKRKAYLQLQQTAVRAVAAAHAVGERVGERAVDALTSHARVVDARHTVVERTVVALASDAAHLDVFQVSLLHQIPYQVCPDKFPHYFPN